jgi:hypothetical protein
MVLPMLQRTGLSNGTLCNRSGGEWKAHAVASKAGSILIRQQRRVACALDDEGVGNFGDLD